MSSGGDGTSPGCRYGHTAGVYGHLMVVTHGYYFEDKDGGAHFLDDTWSFDAVSKTWTKWEVQGPRPCGRFYHVSDVKTSKGGDALVLFGGTDGGNRTNGGSNFLFGPEAQLNDVWQLSLETAVEGERSWQLLHGGGCDENDEIDADGAPCPRKREQAGGAYVEGRFYVFGGLAGDRTGEPDGLEALADLWALDAAAGKWSKLEAAGQGPLARFGHGFVADGDGALVTGGRERNKEDEDDRMIFDDLWRLDCSNASEPTWSLLCRDPMLQRTDACCARVGREFLVYGGNVALALCAELPATGVVFDEQFGVCAPLPIEGKQLEDGVVEPYGRIHASLCSVSLPNDAAHQVLLLFGGESVQPYMYHGSVYEARLFFPDSPQRREKLASSNFDVEDFADTNIA